MAKKKSSGMYSADLAIKHLSVSPGSSTDLAGVTEERFARIRKPPWQPASSGFVYGTHQRDAAEMAGLKAAKKPWTLRR
jgi:hypothetical protein